MYNYRGHARHSVSRDKEVSLNLLRYVSGMKVNVCDGGRERGWPPTIPIDKQMKCFFGMTTQRINCNSHQIDFYVFIGTVTWVGWLVGGVTVNLELDQQKHWHWVADQSVLLYCEVHRNYFSSPPLFVCCGHRLSAIDLGSSWGLTWCGGDKLTHMIWRFAIDLAFNWCGGWTRVIGLWECFVVERELGDNKLLLWVKYGFGVLELIVVMGQ